MSPSALNDELARVLDDLKGPPPGSLAKAGPQAKLILIFGYAVSTAAGQTLAGVVNERLQDPELVKRLGNLLSLPTLDTRSNGYASTPVGQISIELFVAFDGPLPRDAYPSKPGCVGRA
jgi:hypothetical protein